MSTAVFSRLILVLASFAIAVLAGGISTAKADSRPVATQVGQLDEPKEISSLAFSSDGTRLAAVVMLGAEVHVWQLGDKRQIVQRLPIGDISTLFTDQSGVLFSPDGKLVAMVESGDRRNNFGMVRVWDQTGSVIHEIPEDKRNGLRSSIGFSPDSKVLLRTYDGTRPNSGDQLFAHETKTWAVQWSLNTSPAVSTKMSVSPDGKWAALGLRTIEGQSLRSEIAIVDLARHEIVRRVPAFGDGQEVKLLQWSPDSGRLVALASVGYSGSVPSPMVDVNPQTGQIRVLGSDTGGGMKALVFGGNGKYMITAGEHMPVRIHDSKSMALLQSIPTEFAKLAVSRDGQYLAVAGLRDVTLWHLE